MENNKNCANCLGHLCAGLGKSYAVKALTIFLILASFFIFFNIIEVYKSNQYIGQDSVGNTITFSGKGEVFAVADIATFSFNVRQEAKTPNEAQELSANKINKVLDFLKDNEIDEKDIKTTNYNLSPHYEWQKEVNCISVNCPRANRVFVGYEVNQSVVVKIRNVEKAGEILAGIGGFDVTNISGLSFSVDDEDKLQREARKLAIEDAKEKAKQLAQDLGVRLIRVVNFNESGAYPIYYDSMVRTESAFVGSGEKITPEIPVGENKITSNITITYEIR